MCLSALAIAVLNSSSNLGLVAAAGTSQCQDDSFDGTFDLIYTWWTNKPQSKPLVKASATEQAASGSKSSGDDDNDNDDDSTSTSDSEHHNTIARRLIENQREIMYNLRGVEQFGMLEHVRLIHVLVHDNELTKFGPPRDINWKHPKIRLVSSSMLGMKGPGGYEAKLASLHMIPDVHCWALLLQDDVFLMKQFSMDALYDAVTHKQVKYHADTYVQGWCDDFGATTNHGPFFFSMCRYAEIYERYKSRFDDLRDTGEFLHHAADPQCLYDNVGIKEGWAELRGASDYIVVCHINGGCSESAFENPHTMYMNIQGQRFSDEYGGDQTRAITWIHNFFPTPSQFEVAEGVEPVEVEVSWEATKKISSCRGPRADWTVKDPPASTGSSGKDTTKVPDQSKQPSEATQPTDTTDPDDASKHKQEGTTDQVLPTLVMGGFLLAILLVLMVVLCRAREPSEKQRVGGSSGTEMREIGPAGVAP